jgi:holin-like protein
MKNLIIVAAQLVGLVVINKAGYAAAAALHLPVPGNAIGMLFLLALLAFGAVKLDWIQAGASVLTRHLAFFFIPIAVGLMAFGKLFLENGAAILATLVLSAVFGICASGFTSQALMRGTKKTP